MTAVGPLKIEQVDDAAWKLGDLRQHAGDSGHFRAPVRSSRDNLLLRPPHFHLPEVLLRMISEMMRELHDGRKPLFRPGIADVETMQDRLKCRTAVRFVTHLGRRELTVQETGRLRAQAHHVRRQHRIDAARRVGVALHHDAVCAAEGANARARVQIHIRYLRH